MQNDEGNIQVSAECGADHLTGAECVLDKGLRIEIVRSDCFLSQSIREESIISAVQVLYLQETLSLTPTLCPFPL